METDAGGFPHNLDAESSVLGAILISPDLLNLVVPILKERDFFPQSHRDIYRAMLALTERGEAVDILTVANEVDQNDVSGSYVSSLVDAVPDVANVEHYARIVKEKSTLRRIILASQRATKEGFAEQKSAQELLGDLTREVFGITEDAVTGGFDRIGEITKVNLDVIDMAQESKALSGVPTGYDQLDSMTSGLQAGDLIVLAARPSVGKTALSLNIAQHAAVRAKKSVGFFSLEMSKEQVGFRVLCSEADVDAKKVRDGYASDIALRRLVLAQTELASAKLFVDDAAVASVPEIRAKAQRLKREHGLDLVVVDYLQLMASHGKADSRNHEVAMITRGLKLLAKELKVPILALSQLSRNSELRNPTGNGRPQLSDLRDSGAIEQDADVVIFLWRKDYYADDPDKKGMTELIIAKQRNGPIGEFPLYFAADKMTFQTPRPMAVANG